MLDGPVVMANLAFFAGYELVRLGAGSAELKYGGFFMETLKKIDLVLGVSIKVVGLALLTVRFWHFVSTVLNYYRLGSDEELSRTV